MNNRNQHRVLSEEQIKDIVRQVANDLAEYKSESADTLMDHYLRGDAEGLFEIISNWIELAEDNVIHQINHDLMEDTFDKESSIKTLVIHPKDESTDFLKKIYQGIENATVITGGISKNEVRELITTHDRVVMLGHGCSLGLFSVGQFSDDNNSLSGLIIDYSMVSLLNEKSNNIFIWCNADLFVNKHQLKGIYSGMFISEVSEATGCGLPNTPQQIVSESNNVFAELLGSVIDKPIIEAYDYTKRYYNILAETNQIAAYNNDRLYLV